MPADDERINRIATVLKDQKIDALICQLPENVVFLTGFWPLTGTSWIVFSAKGGYELIIPACEAQEAEQYGERNFLTYEWAHLKASDPNEQIQKALASICKKYNIEEGRMGIEESFGNVAPPLNVAEPCIPCKSSKAVISQSLPKATLVDAQQILSDLRVVKTPIEIEKLRIANEIAAFGLAAFKMNAQEGISEIELACMVNDAVAIKGSNYKGVKSARGFAQVSSGANTLGAWRPCEITTSRKLQNGDIVLLELGVVADGFWADNTRLKVVGGANNKQKEIYALLLKAQKAAMDSMKPGVKMGAVDKVARDIICDAGYGDYFIHITGHGIGWRYHEFPPLLAPGNETVLKEGMVTSVEPGIYMSGFGGMRIEDIVAVNKDGVDILSTFDRNLS